MFLGEGEPPWLAHKGVPPPPGPLPFPQRALFWRIVRYGSAAAFPSSTVPRRALLPAPPTFSPKNNRLSGCAEKPARWLPLPCPSVLHFSRRPVSLLPPGSILSRCPAKPHALICPMKPPPGSAPPPVSRRDCPPAGGHADFPAATTPAQPCPSLSLRTAARQDPALRRFLAVTAFRPLPCCRSSAASLPDKAPPFRPLLWRSDGAGAKAIPYARKGGRSAAAGADITRQGREGPRRRPRDTRRAGYSPIKETIFALPQKGSTGVQGV